MAAAAREINSTVGVRERERERERERGSIIGDKSRGTRKARALLPSVFSSGTNLFLEREREEGRAHGSFSLGLSIRRTFAAASEARKSERRQREDDGREIHSGALNQSKNAGEGEIGRRLRMEKPEAEGT